MTFLACSHRREAPAPFLSSGPSSSSFFLSSRVSAHVNVPALVGMKLTCLAPSGFGILSRLSRDLRDSQKELSRR
jgi:hypothetical protein